MCGICGVISTGGNASRFEPQVRQMMSRIVHRGPDGEGYSAFENAALGHRRLSIIDPQNGQQPMSDTEADLSITFNGEIYGFRDTRMSLEELGDTFRTGTDTEVLLKLYRRYGTDMLSHVSGAFAFCIWDNRHKIAFLARDRFGEKPLYYLSLESGRTVAFCSEVEGLSDAFEFDRSIDQISLAHFLGRGFVPPHRTIFSNMSTLPPGTAMTIINGETRTWRYWDIPMPAVTHGCAVGKGLADAAEGFRDTLLEVVRKQLVADVPVNFFLSGGLDSSSIVTLASKVGFQGQVLNYQHSEDQSQLRFARLVAERSGVPLTLVDVPAGDPLEMFEKATAAYGEPFWDSSLIGVFNICALASRYSKVIISGDGADELLGGYVWWYSRIARLQEIRDMPLLEFLARMPVAAMAWTMSKLARRRAATQASTDARLMWNRIRGTTPSAVREEQKWQGVEGPVLALGIPKTALRSAQAETAGPAGETGLSAVLQNDQTNYLCGNMMVKTDRASMRSSIEVRCPFLDHRLVEYLAQVPIDFKVTSRGDKILLREAMANDLPPEVLSRDKQGFGVRRHDRDEDRQIERKLADRLGDSDARIDRIVDPDAARALMPGNPGFNRPLLVLSNWADRHA